MVSEAEFEKEGLLLPGSLFAFCLFYYNFLSSYGCPVKPDSKAGCTLLQFFSKYDQGPQAEKLAGCLV